MLAELNPVDMAECVQQLVHFKGHHPQRHGLETKRQEVQAVLPTHRTKMGSREQVRPEREQSRDPLQALALVLEPI